jgi:hypothetical protein
MAEIAKKTKRYPSDLTDEEWERIAPLLPKGARRGRKPAVDLREVLNAIRYMARSGGGWRMLPRDFCRPVFAPAGACGLTEGSGTGEEHSTEKSE